MGLNRYQKANTMYDNNWLTTAIVKEHGFNCSKKKIESSHPPVVHTWDAIGATYLLGWWDSDWKQNGSARYLAHKLLGVGNPITSKLWWWGFILKTCFFQLHVRSRFLEGYLVSKVVHGENSYWTMYFKEHAPWEDFPSDHPVVRSVKK